MVLFRDEKLNYELEDQAEWFRLLFKAKLNVYKSSKNLNTF